MKLGFGLYRHQLDERHFRFARQCGATHLVVHLVDYFRKADATNPADTQPTGGIWGWGHAGEPDDPAWTLDALLELRQRIEAHGLKFHAVENLDPAIWHDVLLAGPKRDEQLERIRQIIRNLGAAGVDILGYNFSLAGVYGRCKGPFARGGAESVGLAGEMDHTPVPQGMVWNMIYDAARLGSGPIPPCTHDELWDRLRYFLEAVLPVAEDAGLRLAAHPDDPPLHEVRGTPRLVYRPELYQRLADISRSPGNQFEYCVGTLAEMAGGTDIYEATANYARAGRIGYVHLRNVRGKVPDYRETFIDEGDVNIPRILEILAQNGFEGVLIPDHTPLPDCDAPWHAGMAFAMGYLRGIIGNAST